MTDTVIRLFAAADRDKLAELFTRAGADSPTGELWGHAESEAAVYLTPYAEHEQGTLLLAEVGGQFVGYLAGCADSSAFPGESERMKRAVKEFRLTRRWTTVRFFARAVTDWVGARIRSEPTAEDGFSDPRWPAHLHINVAADARGTGVAGELMTRWQMDLINQGSSGCHLQTLVENTRAIRFFERSGFVQHGPAPLVPGIRHEGNRLHQQTMVWTP